MRIQTTVCITKLSCEEKWQNRAWWKVNLHNPIFLTLSIFLKKHKFGSQFCFHLGKEAPNLERPPHQAILWLGTAETTCWDMHLRTDLVQGSNRKMTTAKLKINYKAQK